MVECEHFDAVVVGGGIAGLTAAAELSHHHARTLVVERHTVPGGCASFYQRDGFRFDVGATLISGFAARGIHRILNARYTITVSPGPVEPAMTVHLPDKKVVRFGDARWQDERIRAFGPMAEPFFAAQERIADAVWDLSSRLPALPYDVPGALAIARAFRPRHLGLLATTGATLGSILPPNGSRALRTFVDAQLLITAQTDAARADLAYGATALDIAREGTFHFEGGVSTISTALLRSLRRAGARIVYRRSVAALETRRGRVTGVVLDDGRRIGASRVIAAIPVHDAARLDRTLFGHYRERLAALPERWGAFTVYCGLPAGVVLRPLPEHHQVVGSYDAPLGEGNSVFVSISRARDGCAVTLSTHTDVARWERATADGREPALRREYRARLLAALDRCVPGASQRAVVIEDATPQTFYHYTGRRRGLVGGLPQTPHAASFGAIGHATPLGGFYLCGDTIFPGQSTVGASLSGFNAARAALYGLSPQVSPKNLP